MCDGNISALDYHLREMEANEQRNREIYQDLREEFGNAICECICQANKDEIELDDIIAEIESAFFESQDLKIKIEVVKD